MAAKRVAVTGGYGFIGSALIRLLLSETDYEVLNIDKLTYAGNLDNLRDVAEDSRYAFVRADICDRDAVQAAMKKHGVDTVVLSGGVFQNELLLEDVKSLIKLEVWTNAAVPPNDGGISLGQAALSAVAEHVLE